MLILPDLPAKLHDQDSLVFLHLQQALLAVHPALSGVFFFTIRFIAVFTTALQK
jgi:hypothetical protein